jgi:hypothetical protein
MAFARQLLKGDRKELAMLRRAHNERCYGGHTPRSTPAAWPRRHPPH